MSMSTESGAAPAGAASGHFLGWVTRLVHDHRARLVAIVRREGLTLEDAIDCVQDTFQSFLLLPQARLLVEEPEDSAKLLVVLARNIARNKRRKHENARPHLRDGAFDDLAADTASADEVVGRAEAYVTMVGCLATLSEIQRAVVNLRLVDEVAGEDVAQLLDTTPGNVAILLHRAKRKLRACLPEQ
jgi:RNA polymerase sigma-70 factor (ECF subfamily)